MQPFFVNVARIARAETRAAAAHVDPVRPHGEEAQQLCLPKKWSVDRHIVEMLAADFWMIDEKHVAWMDAVLAVDFDAVLYRHAKVGQEDRQRSLVLRHRTAFVIQDRDAVVLHLVDHHVIGGAFEHHRHFVGGGPKSTADNFYRNRIDRHKFSSSRSNRSSRSKR